MRQFLQPIRFLCQACFMAGLFFPLLPEADVIGQKVWISVVFVGVFFCGWICPFGAVQDWISWTAGRLHIPRFRMPPAGQQYIQLFRYIFYALSILGITFFFSNTLFYFKHNLIMGMIEWTSGLSLAFFLLAAVFIDRPFCNYFCLKGAADGLMSVVRPIGIKRDKNACIQCGLCRKACPMNILVDRHDFVRHPNCINCMRCISACPKKCVKFGLIKLSLRKND